MKNVQLYILLLLSFASLSIHAQQGERRIADCLYNMPPTHPLTAIDSIRYLYTAARLPDSSWGIVPAYDSLYEWTDYLYTQHYQLSDRQIQGWTPSGKPLTILRQRFDSLSGGFISTVLTTDSYTVSNKPLVSVQQYFDTAHQSWINSQMTVKAYDNSSRQIEQVTFTWDTTGGGQWDTTVVYYEGYNNAGQLSLVGFYQKGNANYSSVNQYSYNGLGQVDTLWRLVTFAGHAGYSRTIESYDLSGNLSRELEQDQDSTGNWHDATRVDYTYDASNNMTGHITQSLDTSGLWINSQKYVATFDSYNMITTYTMSNWDTSGNWVTNRKRNYYYEQYTLPAGIGEVSIGQLHIYPVPVSGLLHIDIGSVQPQGSDIAIFDLTGREIGSWHTNAATYYIPVSTLPEGTYILSVNGNRKTFNIVR